MMEFALPVLAASEVSDGQSEERHRSGDERSNVHNLFTWFHAGNLKVHIGFLADPLSVVWILLVTGLLPDGRKFSHQIDIANARPAG